MSELFDKQVIAQKEKNLWGSRKLLQAHIKRAMKMKQTKEDSNTRINVIDRRMHFIRCIQKAGENDLHKL